MHQRGCFEVSAAHEEGADRQRDRRGPNRLRDRPDQRRWVGEARPRLLRETAVDDLRHAWRHERSDGGERRRRSPDVQRQQTFVRCGEKRQPSREGVVGDHTQRVDVAAPIDGVAACLLGTHECRGADHSPARCGRTSEHPGPPGHPGLVSDAEVGEQRPSGRAIEQDVVGLHVPVHHTARVRIIQSLPDVAQQAARLVGIERPMARDPLRKCFSRNVRHREKHEPADLVDRENRHNVRVGQARHRPRLAQKSPAARLVGCKVRVKHLDRDAPVQARLAAR